MVGNEFLYLYNQPEKLLPFPDACMHAWQILPRGQDGAEGEIVIERYVYSV